MASDHHSAYLARALAALTPEGRARVDELLDQLAEAARADERVVGFAAARRAEVAAGRPDPEPLNSLTQQELDVLLGGFLRIRDQERRDDVADWANAVVALLEDALAERQEEGRA
ncbi:MAG TPA: hypothetical protein VFJ60_13430 [Gaiella sp.]|nr:hypothetical protein [Gaiella sp.]